MSACAAAAPAGKPVPCPALTLRFIIDKDYDTKTLFSMLHHDDPAGLASRSAAMGLDKDFARRIHDAPDHASVSAELTRTVDARYAQVGEALETAREEYEKLWGPLVGLFSNVITSTTQHCWFHSAPATLYTDVVSAFHPGLSDWYGNTVATKYDLPEASKRRILAHEIVLSQVFHIVRKYHPRSEISDWKVWVLSELTAVWILSDPRLMTYWPGFPTRDYFARSNYPQLAGVEEELRPVFERRAGFRAYVDEAVARLQKIDEGKLTKRPS
ncbi:MAG: hypothetical protein NTY77_06745 [Elusimicrobia bacterium]|nr:hypothetical protein [Elusimicrobiota bacterium]